MYNLFLKIKGIIKRIYSNYYELTIYEGTDKRWWCGYYNEWVIFEKIKNGACSHKLYKNKYEAFKEFDAFTESGIVCILIKTKWRFNKRTFVEYHSDEQDYFNIKN